MNSWNGNSQPGLTLPSSSLCITLMVGRTEPSKDVLQEKFWFPKSISLHRDIWNMWMWKIAQKKRAKPSKILTMQFLRLREKINCFCFFTANLKFLFSTKLIREISLGNMRKTVSEFWPTCPNARRHDQTSKLKEILTVRSLPRPKFIMTSTVQPLQKQCHVWAGKKLERKPPCRGTPSWNWTNIIFKGNLLWHRSAFVDLWKVVTNSMHVWLHLYKALCVFILS